jgi:hypothetical protein
MNSSSAVAATCAAVLFLAGGCGEGSKPEPGPAETLASPDATQLISYGDDGVRIRSKADVDQLEDAPQSFKDYMVLEIEELLMLDEDLGRPEGCDEPPTLVVKAVHTSGYASGAFVRCGGAASIWAIIGGLWREVWSGQENPSCDEMHRLGVPNGIAPETCRDGEDEVPYDRGSP